MDSTSKTLSEYSRGIIGGILFSLPLLYTMEVWWTGFIASPLKLLILVFVTYLLLLGYNTFAGMRKDAGLRSILWDSVEEMFLALVISSLFLFMIQKIGVGMSFREIAGKVILESMMVAIGISVGKAQLGQQQGTGAEDEQKPLEDRSKLAQVMKLSILSICGAVLISSNVAPTEEILILAIVAKGYHLVAMVAVSLLMSMTVLYFSDFKGTGKNEESVVEMGASLVIVYMSALAASFFFLWIFDRIGNYSFYIVLSEVIVLAIPASLGASAGRLLIGK